MGDEHARLRPCPACEKMVSKWTAACPGCGCPLARKIEIKWDDRYQGKEAMAGLCRLLALVLAFGFFTLVYLIASATVPWETNVILFGAIGALASIIFWVLSDVLQLLLQSERNSRRASEEHQLAVDAAVADREADRELSPAELEACEKLSPALQQLLREAKEVSVEVELLERRPLGTSGVEEWKHRCGLELQDYRPSYQVLLSCAVDRLRGRIHTSRLLDLARQTNVAKVTTG